MDSEEEANRLFQTIEVAEHSDFNIDINLVRRLVEQ